MYGYRKRVCSILLCFAMIFSSFAYETATAKVIKPKLIAVNKGVIYLTPGKKQKIVITRVSPKKASKKIVCRSTNKKVATVTIAGVVKGKKAGKAYVVVTSRYNRNIYLKVKIIVKKVLPKKVNLNTKSIVLLEDATYTLKATASPAKAYVGKWTWSSANKSIATVSKKGVVKAKEVGKTKITVKASNGKKATCTVRVTAQEGSTFSEVKGTRGSANTTYIFANGKNYKVKMTSRNHTKTDYKTLLSEDIEGFKTMSLSASQEFSNWSSVSAFKKSICGLVIKATGSGMAKTVVISGTKSRFAGTYTITPVKVNSTTYRLTVINAKNETKEVVVTDTGSKLTAVYNGTVNPWQIVINKSNSVLNSFSYSEKGKHVFTYTVQKAFGTLAIANSYVDAYGLTVWSK